MRGRGGVTAKTLSTAGAGTSGCSTSFPALGIVSFYILAVLRGVQWCLSVVVIAYPPRLMMVNTFFMCLVATRIIILGKVSIQIFCPFFFCIVLFPCY